MSEDLGTRTRLLIGEEGVEKLRNSSAIVCGCGAVGGYAIEGLVRAGVGRIGVIDGDEFSPSNLNRQVLATVDTIGRRKAEVAVERARSINPDIDAEAMVTFVGEDTIPDILEGDWDVLVDCIDTIGRKAEMLRAANRRGMRIFSSMGAAMHLDATAIRIDTLRKTSVCPMAARLRKELRDEDTSGITCVYSVENCGIKPQDRDEHGKSVLGSMPTIPAIFGMTLANETVKYLLGRD
ncbi:MAG: tRNA threonylcarbamoyladenosine dehydratase [archaeon]|nr:tRNA threonylcarbamoyladenosine dehydratase [archaeon]